MDFTDKACAPPSSQDRSRVWHVYPDAALLARRAARGIARVAAEAIAARGAFHVVLAGGSTPQSVYRCLSRIETDWTGWHVYFGDERCLPPEHPDRNSGMATAAWLGQVAIPPSQVHVIPAELGARAAAAAYSATLAGVERFDLVLLGLGEDGHTASLFPGRDWGEDDSHPAALAVFGAPKAPPERVSLSAWRLGRARQVWFLVTGRGKRAAVAAWRGGETIPAAAVRTPEGVDILVEACCYGGDDHE